MKSIIAALAAFAAGANALVARDNVCCFHLTASGGIPGTIGQLDDGQIRIQGPLSPSEFCINSSGGIVDDSGYGCVLTRQFFYLPKTETLFFVSNYNISNCTCFANLLPQVM